MNGNKIKNIWEIIYNCPFILLILFSSLLILPCFNRITNRDCDKKIVKLENAITGGEEEKEKTDSLDAFSKMFDIERNNDNQKEDDLKNNSQNAVLHAGNEGLRKDNIDDIHDNEKRNIDNEKTKDAIKAKNEESYTTKFVEYTPIETNSRYYSDAGKVALTTVYDYVLENDSYFNDAAFLGDSRTLGISDYAGFENADFFCDNGMTIYKLLEDKGVTWQRTGEKVDMKEILQEKNYGKIYIMLGMNELGYGDTQMYLKQYLKVIRQIQEWQPEAVIFVMANLHVSREKNDMESEFNNININDKNVAAARLANGRDIFYLDCNPLFTDEEGYLQEELTFDGVHLYAQHYDKWRAFLMEHGVERTESAESMKAPEAGNAEAERLSEGTDMTGSTAEREDMIGNTVSAEEG